jgi:hypothetical protein
MSVLAWLPWWAYLIIAVWLIVLVSWCACIAAHTYDLASEVLFERERERRGES